MENKKYEFTGVTKETWAGTLHQIRAIRDFRNVKAGDIGGWIEKEENLSHDGDCWVFGDAGVYGNARVFGDAEVYGNAVVYGNARVFGDAGVHGDAKVFGDAVVYGNARVFGDAKVFGDAEVYGDARVCENAVVCGNAKVFGDARVFGDAEVYENAKVTTTVKTFGNAFIYKITVTDKHIKIGCQQHLKNEWKDFEDRKIIEMDGKKALEFWRMFKPVLESLGLFEEV